MIKYYSKNSLTILLLALFFTVFFLFNKNLAAQNWQYLGTPGFSAGQVYISSISMSISKAGIPYVCFNEGYSPYFEIMKFDGNSWININCIGIPANIGYSFFKLNNNDTPYVAFEDPANLGGATVMKFDGSNWNFVGSPGISFLTAKKISMAFDRNNIPYIAYLDLSFGVNNGKVTVMNFVGASWQPVGYAGFSTINPYSLQIAIDSNNIPYVVSAETVGVKVKKFDGSSWVDLDTGQISTAHGNYTSMTFDDQNNPYVAYQDFSVQNKATVKKFDGQHWIDVGSPGISNGAVEYTSINFQAGKLYLSYIDRSDSIKGTMKVFDGMNWNDVGNPAFTPDSTYDLCSAIDTFGIPYAAFRDYSHLNKISVMTLNPTLLINEKTPQEKTTITVSPNPNNGFFKITSSEAGNFAIFNELGILVRTIKLNLSNSNQYLISNLDPGVYYLKLEKSSEILKTIIVIDK